MCHGNEAEILDTTEEGTSGERMLVRNRWEKAEEMTSQVCACEDKMDVLDSNVYFEELDNFFKINANIPVSASQFLNYFVHAHTHTLILI